MTQFSMTDHSFVLLDFGVALEDYFARGLQLGVLIDLSKNVCDGLAVDLWWLEHRIDYGLVGKDDIAGERRL